MGLSVFHDFLVKSTDFSSARLHVDNFLKKTTLIRYASVCFDESRSFSADQKEFWDRLERGIAENRQIVSDLISELELCGHRSLKDLASFKQGFESKILHTVTHMLDGFIGVDSACYNLVEDSHWLTTSLREEIRQQPNHYWLVHVIAGGVQEAVLHETPFSSRSDG